MSKGGKRDGAGRKPGAPNKKTAEVAAKVEASGLTPLEYLTSVYRDESLPAPIRMDAAKAAAPFVHAKLASVEHKGELTVTTQTKEQRDAAVAAAARADS